MKFRNVAKGTRARHIVELKLQGVAEPVPVALHPLLFGEQADVEAGACSFAKSKGCENPKAGDQLYEQGLMLHTVLRGCMDVDSSSSKPEPFFESEKEVLESLDPERVMLLFHQQRWWQNECSPSPRDMSAPDFAKIFLGIQTAGEGEELPFDYLPRKTQRTFLVTLVNLCANALRLSSLVGSLTPENIVNFANSAKDSTPMSPTSPPTQSSETPSASEKDEDAERSEEDESDEGEGA